MPIIDNQSGAVTSKNNGSKLSTKVEIHAAGTKENAWRIPKI